jgi:hypothetical protein
VPVPVVSVWYIYFFKIFKQSSRCTLSLKLSHPLYINFQYIRKHHLFTSFASLHKNIQFDAKNTSCSEYLLQNIHLKVNIRKTLSKFHIQTNICLQIFAYQQIFATYCFKLLRKPFTSLRPHLIFGSYWKYSLRMEYSFPFFIRFTCKIRRLASMRNKRIKPVLFASKRINIRFHITLYLLRTECHGAASFTCYALRPFYTSMSPSIKGIDQWEKRGLENNIIR